MALRRHAKDLLVSQASSASVIDSMAHVCLCTCTCSCARIGAYVLHGEVLSWDRHRHVAAMVPCGPKTKDGKPAKTTQESV